jgi:hypothetical protein
VYSTSDSLIADGLEVLRGLRDPRGAVIADVAARLVSASPTERGSAKEAVAVLGPLQHAMHVR